MAKFVRWTFPIALLFLYGCSVTDPPALETSPGYIPRVDDLERHIECELLPLLEAIDGPNLTTKDLHLNLDGINPNLFKTKLVIENGRSTINTKSEILKSLYEKNPTLKTSLPYLVRYTFIASASMTLDVLDTEGVNPSLNFVYPFNAAGSLGRTWALGAALNGTQEHSQSFVYPINLAILWSKQKGHLINCDLSQQSGALAGNLGLISDVVSGLVSMDATSGESVTSSAGPIVTSTTGSLRNKQLLFASSEDNGPTSFSLGGTFTVNHDKSQTSFAGSMQVGKYAYGGTLTGGLFPGSGFSVSGSLTQTDGPFKNSPFGINPKLMLSGTIISDTQIKILTSTISGDPSNGSTVSNAVFSTKSGAETIYPLAGFAEVFNRVNSSNTLSLDLSDAVFTYSPPSSGSQGTLAITGTAGGTRYVGGDPKQSNNYFFSLTGSTYESHTGILPQCADSFALEKEDIPVVFSITGTLTQTGATSADSLFGFTPKITLTGLLTSKNSEYTFYFCSGALTSDNTTGGSSNFLKLTKPASASGKLSSKSLGGVSGTGVGGGGGSSKGASSGAGGGGGNSNQFNTYLNFQISYGINGGPTFTLVRFKGPGGGNSPFASINRNDSDSLTITFAPACQQVGQNNLAPKTYWDTIPVCDTSGVLVSQTQNNGQTFNLLSHLRVQAP